MPYPWVMAGPRPGLSLATPLVLAWHPNPIPIAQYINGRCTITVKWQARDPHG